MQAQGQRLQDTAQPFVAFGGARGPQWATASVRPVPLAIGGTHSWRTVLQELALDALAAAAGHEHQRFDGKT